MPKVLATPWMALPTKHHHQGGGSFLSGLLRLLRFALWTLDIRWNTHNHQRLFFGVVQRMSLQGALWPCPGLIPIRS